MTRSRKTSWLMAAFVLLIGLYPTAALAQHDPAGRWEGAIDVPGMKIDVSVELAHSDGAWSGSIDMPVQNLHDLALENIAVDGAAVSFTITGVPGVPTFDGTLAADGLTLSGDFTQAGQRLPFSLTRASEAERLAAEQTLRATLDSLRVFIDAALVEWEVPGLAMAIVKDGEVVFSEGFGLRDVERNLPVTENTLFAIGSTTKAMTATIIGTLVDEGLIGWDEPVRSYLPSFKLDDDFATARMTPVDLMTHRSGLPRHDLVWYNSPLNRRQMFDRLQHLEPSADFRTTFQYQNLMFMTAGYLAQEITGHTWEDLVRARLFEPLGMASSNFSVEDSKQAEDHARPYGEEDGIVNEIPFRNIDEIGPAGSVNSNVVDMAQWVKLQLSGGTFEDHEIISENHLKKIHTPQMIVNGTGRFEEIPFTLYGMGWFIQPYRGHILHQHGGGIDGFTARVSFMARENIGLVVLTNKGGTPLPTLAARAAYDRLLGLDVIDWSARFRPDEEEDEEEEQAEPARVAGTTPSHPLEAFAGDYAHPAYGAFAVTLENDTLRATYNGFESRLEHWHYDVFSTVDMPASMEGARVNFQTNVKGDIEQVTVPLEPAVEAIVFTRKPSEALSDPAYLAQFEGKYDMMGQQVITIELNGATLQASIPGQPTYTLEPYKEMEFNMKDLSGFSVRFVKQGELVTEAIITQPNGVFTATRMK